MNIQVIDYTNYGSVRLFKNKIDKISSIALTENAVLES